MEVTLLLKNGYKFRGLVLKETEKELIIDEIKLGKTTVDKSCIAARSERGADSEQ